jgi:NAD+ synthase
MNRIIDYKNLSDKIKEWILSYTVTNKITTLVVGVSGGIDSAVVSTLCAETGLPTLVIGMPLNSTECNTELSNKQIDFLKSKYNNVNGYTIDLSKTFQEF